jgi:hypothetical protein
VAWHTWQLRALMTLGQPPQAGVLYDAWLANFRQRASIERRALPFLRNDNLAAAKRAVGPLAGLKAQGNLLGQRFGLVRCTSNGDRTPVPRLSDGQLRREAVARMSGGERTQSP